MIQRCWRLVIPLLLLSGLVCFASLSFTPTASANILQPRNQAHQAQPAYSGHATIIVLDMSGSMVTSDPNGYRCSAADAYIDLSGVNDYIGLVGLDNNNGYRTGANNFQTAQSWSDPLSTATVQDQQNLKNIIANKSNNCRPDANTPTYDSLSRAYSMLETVTSQHDVSGSVILLTDGVPCPDVDGQITAIRNDLLPKFAARGWPIDTIGLGQDAPIASGQGCTTPGTLPGTFHDFLKGISSVTKGDFYDDGAGPVPNVSPLNIGPFFVKIFAKYSGNTVTEDVPPTPLDGTPFTRNFNVVDGSNSLDIVAVKDSPNIAVTLSNPDGQVISPNDAGVLVSTDSYHVIYSIQQPQPGQWIISANGSGQFIMYSLQKTNIAMNIDNVQLQNSNLQTPHALPLGQNLVVTAHLTINGQPTSDTNYSVNGGVSNSNGDCAHLSNPFTLSENAGIYQGTVNVPADSPSGPYDILLCASTGTRQNVVASQTLTVQLEIFPTPLFQSAQTHQYTDTTINANVVAWPFPLPQIYSLPGIDHLSSWPLQGYPAQAYAAPSGQVQWNGQVYHNATITATFSAVTNGECKTGFGDFGQGGSPVAITQDNQGNFTAQFTPPASGLYQIVFSTSGSFHDSQGNFGQTGRCVYALIGGPGGKLGKAVWATAVYLAILITILSLLHFWFITPRPFGQWVRNQGGSFETNRSFNRAHRRNPFRWIYRRNRIFSREAGMPRGLEFRFRRFMSKHIEVRPHGIGRRDWQFSDGSRLLPRFQRARELVYSPPVADQMNAHERFTILSEIRRKSSRGSYGGFGDYDSGFSGATPRSPKRKPGMLDSVMAGNSAKSPKRPNKRPKGKNVPPWERY